MPHSVLIVDDEAGIRQSLLSILRDEGYRSEAVESGEACLDTLEKEAYDVVLLDVWLPQMDGLKVLERLQERGNAPMVNIVSSEASSRPYSAARDRSWRMWPPSQKGLRCASHLLVSARMRFFR